MLIILIKVIFLNKFNNRIMKIFEFEIEIKPTLIKKYYHNNITSKYVDLTDFKGDDLLKILNKCLRLSKLYKIIEIFDNTSNFKILKIYDKPFLPKYFTEALKLTSFDNLVIKRNGYYKIKHNIVAKTLDLSIDEIKNNFNSYDMYYGSKPFYIIDDSPITIFKYSFLATDELETIFEKSIVEQTVLDSEDEDFSSDEENINSQQELRKFQLEELELMLNNNEYYFANCPRSGTTKIISTYIKRQQNERILLLVSRKTQEIKYKKLIKYNNVVITTVNEFNKITDKYFDTIICDECHNDYFHTFEEHNPIIHRSKFIVNSTNQNVKTFYFSSTIPNEIDFNKFYEFSYYEAVKNNYCVPISIELPSLSLKEYLKITKSKHILIVSDEKLELKLNNIIIIFKEDNVKQRTTKIKEFLEYAKSNHPKILISPTVILEGLDLPECDEIILYKPNYKFTNIIQVCGRCIEKTEFKNSAKIIIFDKTNIDYIYQYFNPDILFEQTKSNELILYKLRKYISTFKYDFITNYKKCLSSLIQSFELMDNYFDRSLINPNIINLFMKSNYGQNIIKHLIDDKFEFLDFNYYIELLNYNGETKQLPKTLKLILNKQSENTSIENIYTINGFNYSTKLKPKIKYIRSVSLKNNIKNIFYEKYGTTKLNDSDILFYNHEFYIYKNIK